MIEEKSYKMARLAIKTWEECENWGDTFPQKIQEFYRQLLSRSPSKVRCPHLKTLDFNEEIVFPYCELRCNAPENEQFESSDVPQPTDPRDQSKIDYSFLQLFCLENNPKCIELMRTDSSPQK